MRKRIPLFKCTHVGKHYEVSCDYSDHKSIRADCEDGSRLTGKALAGLLLMEVLTLRTLGHSEIRLARHVLEIARLAESTLAVSEERYGPSGGEAHVGPPRKPSRKPEGLACSR